MVRTETYNCSKYWEKVTVEWPAINGTSIVTPSRLRKHLHGRKAEKKGRPKGKWRIVWSTDFQVYNDRAAAVPLNLQQL